MSSPTGINILGIESSCDDTAAAVVRDGKCLANIVAGQKVHEQYGGVVPELASRAHQQNIVPVVDAALKTAGVKKSEITAIAFTRGPGLMGSLLVGSSFAKGLSLALEVPLIEVNHMQAHILAHFIEGANKSPSFPFLCLTVSGGHTQIVLVKDHFDMEVIGETTDDAAGEAFDKAAKILGLPYPGGPLIDKYAKEGNALAYAFPRVTMPGLSFSFSGLKTAFMYFMKEQVECNPDFIKDHLFDICASYQKAIVETLMHKLEKAMAETGIREIAVAGGVSANSFLRNSLLELEKTKMASVYLPPFEYCTDNAAMIAITGYYKFLKGDLASQSSLANARWHL
jgi:N6-L-threonylcarbamoyladenine synthase